MTIPALFLLFAITGDVRRALNQGDFRGAESLVEEHRKQHGISGEYLEAYSWLGRGALAAKKYDDAQRYASETKRQALEQLKTRKLDAERHLPIALGAAIEVHAQVLAGRGDRAAAVEYLTEELERYRSTSIRTRIQKNINLLDLTGKPAPALQGVRAPKGPALLFFWAHWCGDCKSMVSVLEQVRKTWPGISVTMPTQLYGYAERGRDAGPDEERKYIGKVHQDFYSVVRDAPAPINDENFKVYGASTTPTIVLIDRAGVVQFYHPGKLTLEELRPKLDQLMK